MKELQKVKHVPSPLLELSTVLTPCSPSFAEALIDMAHRADTDRSVPAGKDMEFYMSTVPWIYRSEFASTFLARCSCILSPLTQVVEMINTTMRSSIDEQFQADKARDK